MQGRSQRLSTLRAVNNLAQTLHAQGDLAGARKLQEQVLEARGRLLGKEHPDNPDCDEQARRDAESRKGPGQNHAGRKHSIVSAKH
jgi:hypothetical protein